MADPDIFVKMVPLLDGGDDAGMVLSPQFSIPLYPFLRLSVLLTQVANPDFFLKMVPLLDGGDDVGMVLSPQSFHNLQPHADIFNHANIQFWEYAQHGYDALDFISCTGALF